jgi:hypothetical protein
MISKKAIYFTSESEYAMTSFELFIYLAIRCLIANYCTRWPVTLKGSDRLSLL